MTRSQVLLVNGSRDVELDVDRLSMATSMGVVEVPPSEAFTGSQSRAAALLVVVEGPDSQDLLAASEGWDATSMPICVVARSADRPAFKPTVTVMDAHDRNSSEIEIALGQLIVNLAARTKVEALECQNRELLAQLETRESLVGLESVAAAVAHDFNNVLAAIISYGRFLVDSLVEGDGRRQQIVHVLRSADGARKLCRQLLMFARLQPRKSHAIDLNSLIDSLIAMVRATAPESLRFEFAATRPSPEVYADPTHLEYVVFSLLMNAQEAIDGDGCVQLTTSIADAGVFLDIVDDGIGIEPEIRPQVFEPFFTTKSAKEHAGLGLSVCHSIISSFGGTLNFCDAQKGCHVRVCLPHVRNSQRDIHLPAVEKAD